MPILGSFGAGSARGFGQTAGAGEPAYVNATGGDIVEEGSYRIHVFTGPGTFEVSKLSDCVPASDPTNKADYMIVGGGGASGSFYGGGGGAGGFRETPGTATGSYTASPKAGSVSATTLAVSSYPVTVGSGGAAPAPNPTGGNCSTPGGDSTIFSATSAGGGNGGGRNGRSGASGASGGGGGQSTGSGSGNSPPTSPPQGSAGGAYGNSPGSVTPPSQQNEIGGGGGGGATAPGEQGGVGGTGAGTQITTCAAYGDDATPGATRVFAGGGSGIRAYCTGPGGGGRRGVYPCSTGPAQVNTGGGGGGCAATGGSGVVMIRYRIL